MRKIYFFIFLISFFFSISAVAQNNLCSGADPFCTGSTYNFPAGVSAGSGETGPEYGCLGSTPNPVWYYLKVATAGVIEIYMYGSASEDIDFACWGPFASPTAPCTAQLTAGTTYSTHSVAGASANFPSANMIDCSFDAQEMEWCYIPNAQVGEYYLLMITNYSNLAQNIIFSQTGGTGSTDCSIVAPPVGNNGPLCVGQTLNLTVSNPIPGATYAWTGPGFTSSLMQPSITNVTTANAGVYSLVVTVGGVSSTPVTTTVVVNPNPVITATATPAAICAGASTSLSASSNVAGTTFSWTPGSLSGSPLTVSPSVTTTYTVTGDAAGCSGSSTVTVSINPEITPTFNALGPYCLGATPGTLPTTSTNSITGVWSPATVSTASAGNTLFTFTPNAGQCGLTTTMNVTVNALPTINFPALPALCDLSSPLTLNSATPSGGTYSGTGVSSNSFNPATSGTGVFTITYTYTNANTCTSSATQNITVNATPTATFTLAPTVGCVDVPVTVTYTGNGDAGTNYNWNFNGGTATPGTGAGPHSISWSSAGNYTVSLIASANGCSSQPVSHTVSIGLLAATTQIGQNVSCYGAADGQATVNVVGGASPYVYNWQTSPVQVTQVASGLAPGTYTVNVSDDAGCTSAANVTITEPGALHASITDSTMIACYGALTGMAEVTATGGTPPYQYAWASSTSTTNQVVNYAAGNYSVTVTDSHGCVEIVPFIITQNPMLSLTLSPTDEGCANSCTGELATSVTGGVAPYNYLWSPGGQVTPSILDLCTGTYILTVSDAENCTVSNNAVIGTNSYITALASIDPMMGIAPATTHFSYTGTGGVIFTWDFGDGETSTDVDPIHVYTTEGTYTIVLTVNSGLPDFCTDTFAIQIVVYPPSVVTVPNVYTPNGDGYNDVFKVESTGLDAENMVIFNRWGKKVWEWSELNGEWKGEVNSGGMASVGEYFYIYDASGFDGKEYHMNGTVTLLR